MAPDAHAFIIDGMLVFILFGQFYAFSMSRSYFVMNTVGVLM